MPDGTHILSEYFEEDFRNRLETLSNITDRQSKLSCVQVDT